MSETEQTDSIVENRAFPELVDEGIYEFAGFDEDGEMTFRLDTDIAKIKAPHLYWEHHNDMTSKLLTAIEEGFLEWEVTVHAETGELEEHLVVTEKAALL